VAILATFFMLKDEMPVIVRLLTSLLFIAACSTQKSYPVVGVITEIHSDRHELTIHHDEIPNFMMAMTMNFKLKANEDISKFMVGDSIHFRLSFEGNSGYATHFEIIDNVKISTPEPDDFWDEDDPYAPIDMGDTLTDATFTDMFGKEMNISDSDGKFRFISFIFSRCPMPNMCPALIFKQRFLAESFEEDNIEFIMISFDHVYDTPEILHNTYESTFSGHDNWQMWSSYGHMNDLYKVSKQSMFGFWGVEENDIGHNMRCILLDPNRRLIKTFDGLDWLPKDAKNDIEMILKTYVK
jgi:protein SCO1/2